MRALLTRHDTVLAPVQLCPGLEWIDSPRQPTVRGIRPWRNRSWPGLSMTMVKLLLRTQYLLGKLSEEAASAEDKEQLLVAIDALSFIMAIGQPHGLEEYRKDRAVNGPPLVIAAFNTREEADAWMKNHPDPPHHVNVLIAGEYFLTAFIPELHHRALLHDSVLEYYLEEMIHEGLPAPVATFNTLEEANTWLNSQPEPPRQVFITISGEYYLAVYHYKVNLRALYPISMAAKNVQRGPPED
jgi:hypothetical protein